MCDLDDGAHWCPDISRHHVSPLQTLACRLHLLHRLQLVGVWGTHPGGLDHVVEEAWLRCLPWSQLCPGRPCLPRCKAGSTRLLYPAQSHGWGSCATSAFRL